MHERLLLESIPGAAALVDAQGCLGQVNSVWAEAVPGNPFLQGQQPGCDYLQQCNNLSKSTDGHISLVAIGIVSALEGKFKRLKLEYPVPVHGEIRWFAMRITSDGVGAGVVIAHLDITDRMRWEMKLRRSEQLFKATTENALDLLAILGSDGKVRYASPSYGKTLGYPFGTLPDWKPVETVCEEDRALFQEHCRMGFRLGISSLFEYRALHRDGTIRHLEARAVAVENPGGDRESILLTSRDVSDKKEAEAEKLRMEIELRHSQKMEAIGQLAAGIAHEINTPCQFLSDNMGFLADAFGSLQDLLACLETDQGQGFPNLPWLRQKWVEQDVEYLLEEVPRAIAQSKQGLARISTIVKAMKVFGHPGGEGLATVNLNETLENTLVVAQGEWKYLAEVETDLAADLPTILGSPGGLNQVFLNLIVNAAHAIAEKGAEGKGRISVSTRATGTGAEIRILDTGAGIPEAIRDRIFLPFFTTKAVGKGTGQGLAIVHSVIAKHGGTIEFESEPGRGTCFIIRLPLAPPNP